MVIRDSVITDLLALLTESGHLTMHIHIFFNDVGGSTFLIKHIIY